MLFWYIDICGAPQAELKPSPFGLGFQPLSRGAADVNAKKIMFNPYNKKKTLFQF